MRVRPGHPWAWQVCRFQLHPVNFPLDFPETLVTRCKVHSPWCVTVALGQVSQPNKLQGRTQDPLQATGCFFGFQDIFSSLPLWQLLRAKFFAPSRYFVKVAWGWTFILLLPFIALTNYHLTGKAGVVLKRLCILLVGTAIWYVSTSVFLHIEYFTGSCYKSPALESVQKEYNSKEDCRKGGGFWHGFDISGHSFLLTYCALVIVEEMAVLQEVTMDRSHSLYFTLTSLVVALGCLAYIWIWMFFCTAVYFHDLSQKVFGTLFGLVGWYGTYGFWYLKPFSPGLPPQSTSLNLKQDSYKK
uniref:Fat storage inducing transmembrane protein 2 n=1 Tax=Vombatus ursinus TaxID=29139 RepID=A0A4X2JXM1_VOMUR